MANGFIRIQTQTVDDYRRAARVLRRQNVQFQTYSLEEEKLLHVVIRGITQDITEEEVTTYLREKGFSPAKVSHMKKRVTKEPIPLVLVQLPKNKNEKQIFQIRSVLGLAVSVEMQQKKLGVSQCFRCQ